MINELARKVHQNARNKGFYEDDRNTGEMIALIHSEVSEALEADRKGKYVRADQGIYYTMQLRDGDFKFSFEANIKDTFEDELADAVIRIMDLAEYKGIDLEAHVIAKMRYNETREHKHGKKY